MNKQLMRMPAAIVFCMALVFALQCTGCGGAVELASAWKRTEMTIDGNPNDWEGDLYRLKKANVTIGVRNDETNLYVWFSSNDKNVQRHILNGGFTVWFDPTGGTNETYGIQFPVGYSKGGSGGSDTPMPIPDSYTTVRSPSEPASSPSARMSAMLNSSQNEIKFLGPNKDDVQLSTLIELKTVKVQVGVTRQSFVYELQVPLHKTSDFPFSIAPLDAKKNVIGIEYKTEASTFVDRKSSPSDGGMEGRRGRMMDSPSGTMNDPENRDDLDESNGRTMERQGRGGGENASTGSIDLWTKVPLAEK
ncbi:MAG TPA: hypothetical protein VMU30_04105 [Bacteroidota bacterium]|nr:hypothetical protein [Bacteroidota bacterium]